MVARMVAAVMGMEIAALVFAYLAFGWPVLLIGAPVLVGTVLLLLVVRASEAPRRRLQAARATRWETQTPLPGGLMSGFFEIPAPRSPEPWEARR
ncbi:hypothetical protein ACFQE5_17655 [Pseudonocardia hispaniensis]|uniref:Uncharacterized protein n=1 Tax=Pseudonocardia hispaniensis TaxID=904933 RepID=A0ABW1J5V4_9PSEU